MSELIDTLFRRRRTGPLDLCWLTPSIGLGASPAAGSLSQVRRLGFSAIVDLRTDEERAAGASWERSLSAAGLDLLVLPAPEGFAPTPEQLEDACAWLRERLADDELVLVCCRDGTGRSATLASAALVRIFGYPLPHALYLVRECRRQAVPSERQLVALGALANARPAVDAQARARLSEIETLVPAAATGARPYGPLPAATPLHERNGHEAHGASNTVARAAPGRPSSPVPLRVPDSTAPRPTQGQEARPRRDMRRAFLAGLAISILGLGLIFLLANVSEVEWPSRPSVMVVVTPAGVSDAATPGSGTDSARSVESAAPAGTSEGASTPELSAVTAAGVAAPPIATGPTPAPAAALPAVSTSGPIAAAPTALPATPTLAPGIVLTESFGDNARNWPNNSQATAWFADGAYRLFARDPGRFVAIGAPIGRPLRDVTVSGRFRKVGGVPGAGYGLIVRDQGPASRDGTNQGGRYYVLEVGDVGEVGVWRRETDHWIDLLPWTRSDVVRTGGATNELSVRAVGPRLDFFVNGVQVTSQVDELLPEGGVGIFVGGDQNEVVIDHFVVEALN